MKEESRHFSAERFKIGLSYILHFIIIFQMPQGGAIHAASMAPLIFFAFRWGGRRGLVVGVVYGIFHYLLGMKYSIHPLSIILDYLAGYGVLGLAGFFSPSSRWKLMVGTTVACLCRCALSIVSGAVVFAAYAPKGQDPWLYSLVYNVSYMVPETILTIVVIYLFYPKIAFRLKEVAQRR